MPNIAPLTTAEVAQRLDVGRKAIRGLVRSGKLVPAQKLPGRTGAYLFDREAVDALAAERDA